MSSWAIIENDSLFLMIKRSEKTLRPHQWCFPGGGIKANELPKYACVREVKEETGLDVQVQREVAVVGDRFYFLCHIVSDDFSIKLKENECVDYSWIDPLNLLDLGIIMNLKDIYSIFSLLGRHVHLNEEARKVLS